MSVLKKTPRISRGYDELENPGERSHLTARCDSPRKQRTEDAKAADLESAFDSKKKSVMESVDSMLEILGVH